MAIKNVNYNEKNMFDEYGVLLQHSSIGIPTPKMEYLDVPLRDGSIELTEVLSDRVNYNDRTITDTFKYVGDRFASVCHNITNAIHGQKVQIIYDDDPNFYYSGRVTNVSENEFTRGGTIEVQVTCEPFKTEITDAHEAWLWDTFDFEEGITNDLTGNTEGSDVYTIEDVEEIRLSIVAGRKPSLLYASTSGAIELTFGEETVTFNQSTKSPVYFSNVFETHAENIITVKKPTSSETTPAVTARFYYTRGEL